MARAFQPLRTARRIEGVTYAVRDVVLTARQAAAAGRDMIYLNIGDPCQFDFRTPEHVVEAIVAALRDNRTSYSPSEGIPEALEAIRRDAEERKRIRGVRDVLVGHGASEPIEIVLTALLEPGEGVLIPRPGYPLYEAILAKLGARALPYDLDEENGWQPDPDTIEALVDAKTRALVLINPNNPTGSIADRATLERLLELAARHGLLVLSDEIYDRMILDPEVEHVATASLRDDVPVVTFGGLSKVWLGPGLRIGWAITSGPAEVVAPLVEAAGRLARARLCASHPVQWAIRPALEGPQGHIDEVNAALRRRRDVLATRLAEIPGWSMVAPRGAFYAFPRLELDVDDLEFTRGLILETGVVVVHGSGFGQKPGTRHVRIVFLPPEELIAEACRRIADYCAALAR
ncbi:MAG: aminotransferase class I/II-fold pyridoxal phosphate-dependent enzyme [Acidobacteria bacterium]|nr:MAG: aminotransferase class I/II-fold pyridoxal phosphate-dependent enzyme [Acidobacteriota bacterium]